MFIVFTVILDVLHQNSLTIPLLILLGIATPYANAQIGKGSGTSTGNRLGNYTESPPQNNAPEHLFNIILGRSTDRNVTVRVLFHKDAIAYIA